MIAVYVSTAAFIVAHTINAFVADALLAPMDSHVPRSPSIGPDDQLEAPPNAVETILNSGLFRLPVTPHAESGGSIELSPPSLDAAKKVALLGTVLGKAGGLMAAIEEISTKKQNLYRLGSSVPNVGILSEIQKDRVLFRDGGAEEWLDLAISKQMGFSPPSPASPLTIGTSATPQRRILDRREVNEALSDTARLLTHAQAVPYLNQGKLDGFRLYNVMPMGFFHKIGLQTNDILQRVNGVEIKDPGMVLTLFQRLRNENTIRLDLVRLAQPQTITYEIR